jgi:hypothetical protein
MALKLTQLAAKPTLVRIELSDDEIQKQYGDSLEFWIWDRQPMSQFVRLATVHQNNFGEMVELVNSMVLDEEGNQIAQGDLIFPTDVMMKIINRVVETLGK